MFKEFKKFALQGSVMDLAIGVIIGAAFGKIVTSFVNDILTPLIGLLLGKVDFSGLALQVGDAKVSYGLFINSLIDFVIIAFVIFLLVRQINKMRAAPKEAPTCPFCKSEIAEGATRCPACTSEITAPAA